MINQELVNKIDSLLDKGVTCGFSEDPKPGSMCLEQVICYALGERVTDKPSCVGYEVRDFVILLNDKAWSSPSARAEGMRELAIAQLGSNSLNQYEFREKLCFAVITKLLPAMVRDLGEDKWEKEIKSLEESKSLEEAKKVAHFIFDAFPISSYVFFAADAVIHHACFAVTADYAADATKTGDKYRFMVAHLAVEILKDMESPGCQFL